jgi:hypothetical protein
VTLFALGPASGPLRLGNNALAQQAKPSAPKTSQNTSQAAANVKLDENNVEPVYANFVRVTATPEEVIFDYGLNPEPFSSNEQSVKVSRRLVVNFYTAKRFLKALQLTLDRHESTFGPIELDARRRAVKKDEP